MWLKKLKDKYYIYMILKCIKRRREYDKKADYYILKRMELDNNEKVRDSSCTV